MEIIEIMKMMEMMKIMKMMEMMKEIGLFNKDKANEKNERNDIFYTLQSSSAVLGVYCNFCARMCNFAYTATHENIAFWTHNKNNVICPQCVEKHPSLVYRKLQFRRDIPLDRSHFHADSKRDYKLFGNHEKNKEDFSHMFCASKQEDDELSGRVPFKQKPCNCDSCEKKTFF